MISPSASTITVVAIAIAVAVAVAVTVAQADFPTSPLLLYSTNILSLLLPHCALLLS